MDDKFEIAKTSPFDPVFLIGESQSRTSLLSNFFKKNFDVRWGFLNDCIAKFHNLLPEYGNLRKAGNLRRLISDLLAETPVNRWCNAHRSSVDLDELMAKTAAATYEDALFAIFLPTRDALTPANQYHFEKVGNYQVHLPIVAKIFPAARFIYLVRDGRDAAITDFHKPFSIRNTAIAALKWKSHVESASRFIDGLPTQRAIKIHFEALLNAPESVHELLINFLQIADQDKQRFDDFREYTQQHAIRNYPGRWMQEFTNEDVVTFENIAGNLLKSNGYPIYSQCERFSDDDIKSTDDPATAIISPPITILN